MTTCGMYDYAGEWLFRVGLPAKSGVSGGVAAALPGQLGLGAHSPRLDPRGNSVRGVAACERLSSELGLHLLLPSERPRTGLRRSYRGDTVRSTRTRGRLERDVLEAEGSSIAVSELDGDQGFASTELLVRLVIEDPVPAGWRVLDLRRVTRIDRAAVILLRGLAERLDDAGGQPVEDTIAAGSSFGELALVDGRTRSTRIASIEPTHLLRPHARRLRRSRGDRPGGVRPADPGHRTQPVHAAALLDRRRRRPRGGLTGRTAQLLAGPASLDGVRGSEPAGGHVVDGDRAGAGAACPLRGRVLRSRLNRLRRTRPTVPDRCPQRSWIRCSQPYVVRRTEPERGPNRACPAADTEIALTLDQCHNIEPTIPC